MYSIIGEVATFSFTVTGVESATYSIADAGAAQDEDGAGATSWVTGVRAVKVTLWCRVFKSLELALHRCP